ncbi:response regulator transcription factor [Planctomycetes bacterium K23_9]|uniref:Response regulator protein TodT n=1 Tax=Stieleria marina TaxID=1930275 RepID=A0A517NYE6_9BACT|nr:Response regulator protein TodT [Planctomycetes bacterium K23_9]
MNNHTTAKPDISPDVLVYIIEDDDDFREALRLVVTGAGYAVADFGNAVEFKQRYDPGQAGCLILDFQTPGFDAIGLYESIISRGGAQPFIVISAHGTVPNVAESMRMGAVDFLQKPIDHALLIQRVAESIELDRTRRANRVEKAELLQCLDALTKREREVLDQVVLGLASKQIARKMDIGTSTVDVHRSNLMKKMGIESIIQLVQLLTTHALMPSKNDETS